MIEVPGSVSETATWRGLAVDEARSVELSDDVALLEAGVGGGAVGGDLGDDGSGSVLEIEEVGVVGGDVVHADAEIAVLDLAVGDDLLRHVAGGAGVGDGESGAGEGAGVGGDEIVDADELTVSVDEGAAGVAGVDGWRRRSDASDASGGAGVFAVGVVAVDGGDDAAG